MQKRSRFFLSDDEFDSTLIVTNLKVGYTGLNRYLPESWKRLDRNDEEFEGILTSKEKAHKRVFLYRDPLERFYSYYFHWFVKNSMVAGRFEDNPQIKKSKEFLPQDFYTDFLAMSDEERCEIRVIEKFVTYLPRFYMNDAHVIPQTYLWQILGVNKDFFTDFVSINDMTDFLNSKYDISVPPENKSGRKVFKSAWVEKVIEAIYSDDFKLINSMIQKR